jgi:hypothetical protein
MNASAPTREGITDIHGQDRERASRGHYWLTVEKPGSNSSAEGSVSPGAVKDRIGLLRGSIPRRFEGGVSLPVVKVKAADGPSGREADYYTFGNALRGWVYALLPSLVLWAILIGMIYRVIKR